MPGEQTEFQQAVTAAEGRVIIAGEHASPTHSWIQGALQSGLAAVETICSAAMARARAALGICISALAPRGALGEPRIAVLCARS